MGCQVDATVTRARDQSQMLQHRISFIDIFLYGFYVSERNEVSSKGRTMSEGRRNKAYWFVS